MTEKTSAAKKTVAKKTTARKTTARKTTAAKKSAAQEPPVNTGDGAPPDPVVATADPSGAQPDDSKSVTSVAEEILDGSRRWGTGRERGIALRAAGFNELEVQREVSRLRSKRRRQEQNS